MAKVRQQQQELEKKLAQVDEGYSNFNQIIKKINSAVNQTQKERFEGELKKEIKKLQRTRESLRNYESQDPRNKSRITEARKKIEELMETHKQLEKESKTKAFSKEGLLIAPKVDPIEEEREEVREMIKALQGAFQDKINVREAELEKSRGSKLRAGITEDIGKQIKNLRYHFEKLEQVLRFVENNPATLEQIWPLTDKLDSYLKTEDTSDFESELEQRYKELSLPTNRIFANFPALNEEDSEAQRKIIAKKPEAKAAANVPAKIDPKPVEKGWNTKEALMKIAGKTEKIFEDLPDDEQEVV